MNEKHSGKLVLAKLTSKLGVNQVCEDQLQQIIIKAKIGMMEDSMKDCNQFDLNLIRLAMSTCFDMKPRLEAQSARRTNDG